MKTLTAFTLHFKWMAFHIDKVQTSEHNTASWYAKWFLNEHNADLKSTLGPTTERRDFLPVSRLFFCKHKQS